MAHDWHRREGSRIEGRGARSLGKSANYVRDLPGLCLRSPPPSSRHRQPDIALAAAAEFDFVSLPDALELVLLLVDEPARFRRAALRWHARYCADVPDVGFEEAQAVLACLAGLAGRRPKAAASALAELVNRRGLERASEVLFRWAS